MAKLIVALGLALGWGTAWAGPVKGDISRIGEATHIEFRGLSQWPYEIKRTAPNTIRIQVPAFDPATIAALATWSDSLVSAVEVSKSGPDGSYVITLTLVNEKVESFDYLTDEPSRLIVDLFQPNEPSKAAEAPSPAAPTETGAPEPELKAAKRAPKAKIAVESDGYRRLPAKASRRPAGDERLSVDPVPVVTSPQRATTGVAYDAADPKFLRFQVKDYEIQESAQVASRKSIYVPFPMLKLPISDLPRLLENLPEFVIQPRDDRMNKEARLLLSLYSRQLAKTDRTKDRIGAFLKVYDHFGKTYPDSEYDEIVKNLAAHMHYQRWVQENDPIDFEKSQAIYKYLVTKYPDSALAERTQLWLSYATLEHGNGLETIQAFQEYLRRYPRPENLAKIKMGIADGDLTLNKFSDALAVYQDVRKTGATPLERAEAAYREGDVAFARKDWAEAAKTYQSALSEFSEMSGVFPNAFFNLAESQFWLRQHKESISNFANFLSTYPNHPYGGFAMTRAGEILEAVGAEPGRVTGAYLESFYRYRDRPGAEVARLRLLSRQMKDMKDKELKKATEEINQIAQESKLPGMQEFSVLMMSDGFQRRNDNQSALQQLMAYYQANPTSAHLDIFRARIQRNIAEVMSRQVADGDFLTALKTHAQYQKTWLKNQDRIDVPFIQGKAYEQAGIFSEAAEIYRRVLSTRSQVKPEGQIERQVNELLPSADSIRLRLGAVAIQERNFPEAFKHLDAIRDSQGLQSDEAVERAQHFATVYRERGELDKAKAHLKEFIAAWKGDPRLLTANQLSLAELQLRSAAPEEAEKICDSILSQGSEASDGSDPTIAGALEVKARAQEAQGKDLAAIETYQRLLENFELTRSLGSVRYHVGEILYGRGDLGGAERIWGKLDAAKNGVFRRLADERLGSAKWQNEHRKYIRRIPAMSGFKEE